MDAHPGRYPATVKSYDPARRTCRVEIPGITDGGEVMPEAEIEYPLGDKSKATANATEIEILPNDLVWVEFIGGDPRYPVITGNRNPQTGNDVGWRRWHHANVGMAATDDFTVHAKRISITATESITLTAPSITEKGDVAISDGTLTHQGVNVGFDHGHLYVKTGADISGPPVGGAGGGSSPGDGAGAAAHWDEV